MTVNIETFLFIKYKLMVHSHKEAKILFQDAKDLTEFGT